MPALSPDRLQRSLDSGNRGGIFFLFGEEEFLKEEAATAITNAHLDPATRDFNYDQLRGGDVEPETLSSIAQTPPMMAEHRIVVLRDAQALATNARARAVVEALLDRPVPDLALILIATLPDKTKAAFYERLKRDAIAVEFPPLGQGDLPAWLVDRAHTSGIELELAGARALASTGSDIGVLVQELAKLANYVGERKKINADDVRAIVGSVPRQDRWAWFDLVGDTQFRQARATLPILLDNGESGVGLIIGLGTHFIRLGIAVTGGERALGEILPPYQKWLVGRIAKQARRWNSDAIQNAIDDLLRADRLLKSTSLNEHQVMEELLLRLEQRLTREAA